MIPSHSGVKSFPTSLCSCNVPFHRREHGCIALYSPTRDLGSSFAASSSFAFIVVLPSLHISIYRAAGRSGCPLRERILLSFPLFYLLLCSPERGGLNGRLIFLSERDGDGDVDDDSRGESERGARSGRDDDHTNPPHSPSLPRVVPKGYSRQTVDRLFTKDVTTPN